MENVTLTDGGITTLSNTQNSVEQLFGFSNNLDGSVSILPTLGDDINPEDKLVDDIDKQIKNTQEQIDKIKKQNPNTNLSDQDIKDLYDDFGNDGFLIF